MSSLQRRLQATGWCDFSDQSPKKYFICGGLWHRWKSWISIVWSKKLSDLLTIYWLIEKHQFLSDQLSHEDLIPFGGGSLLLVQKGVSELNEEILPWFISAGRLANFGSSKFTIAVENPPPIDMVSGTLWSVSRETTMGHQDTKGRGWAGWMDELHGR